VAELHKEGGPLAKQAAKIFAESLKWLEAQFRRIGKSEESHDLAVHLLSALEGASLLAQHVSQPKLRRARSKPAQGMVRVGRWAPPP